MDVQHGTCLYCQKPLPKQVQVDHFIPWSRYPADLGHNFVLAHNNCNNAKSDTWQPRANFLKWLGQRINESEDRQ